ncbi:MAG: hypothetical protein JKX76_01305 [Colwellia sp.]|nr:hypothetical protein [Colwellia sp.]
MEATNQLVHHHPDLQGGKYLIPEPKDVLDENIEGKGKYQLQCGTKLFKAARKIYYSNFPEADKFVVAPYNSYTDQRSKDNALKLILHKRHDIHIKLHLFINQYRFVVDECGNEYVIGIIYQSSTNIYKEIKFSKNKLHIFESRVWIYNEAKNTVLSKNKDLFHIVLYSNIVWTSDDHLNFREENLQIDNTPVVKQNISIKITEENWLEELVKDPNNLYINRQNEDWIDDKSKIIKGIQTNMYRYNSDAHGDFIELVVVCNHIQLITWYDTQNFSGGIHDSELLDHKHSYFATLQQGKKTIYVRRSKVQLHTILFPTYHEVDHIDHNGLNNRSYNIRDGGGNININNRRLFCNNTTGTDGIYPTKTKKGVVSGYRVKTWNANGESTDGARFPFSKFNGSPQRALSAAQNYRANEVVKHKLWLKTHRDQITPSNTRGKKYKPQSNMSVQNQPRTSHAVKPPPIPKTFKQLYTTAEICRPAGASMSEPNDLDRDRIRLTAATKNERARASRNTRLTEIKAVEEQTTIRANTKKQNRKISK